jgi:hypothetical protein
VQCGRRVAGASRLARVRCKCCSGDSGHDYTNQPSISSKDRTRHLP